MCLYLAVVAELVRASYLIGALTHAHEQVNAVVIRLSKVTQPQFLAAGEDYCN